MQKEKNEATEYLNKMRTYCSQIQYDYEYNEPLSTSIITEIQHLAQFFLFTRVDITNAKSQTTIDNLLKKVRDTTRKAYDTIKNIFYKEKYINPNNVKTPLNYNCNIVEFYNQLLKIEDMYSDKALFNKELEEIIHTYENYQGYQNIKALIAFTLNQARGKAQKNNYQNLYNIIAEVHKNILKTFEEYYALKNEITTLESLVNETNDEEIKLLYANLKSEFERGTSFNDTQKSIDKLKIACQKAIEKQKRLNLEKPRISELYQSLLSKANIALTKLNIIDDLAKIVKIHEAISKIIEIFKLYTDNLIDIDKILSLNDITFEDIDTDLEKLNEIIKSSRSNPTISAKDYFEKYSGIKLKTYKDPLPFNDSEENKSKKRTYQGPANTDFNF